MMVQPDEQTQEIEVKNRGRTFVLSRAMVEAKLLYVESDRVTKYGVEVHGQEYPVLQVIAVVTESPKIEWSTVNVYRILQKLGYEILVHK